MRIAAFVIYYFAAGFMGNLCALLLRPLLSLVFFRFPEIKNIILYIMSAAVMLFAVSFFSMREGYSDMDLSRFSGRRTAFSCAVSGVIFCFAALRTLDFEPAAGYFYTPHFIPAEIRGIMSNYILLPDIPGFYAAGEYIKRFIAVKQNSLIISVSVCVIFSMGFYKAGKKKWINGQKKQDRLKISKIYKQ